VRSSRVMAASSMRTFRRQGRWRSVGNLRERCRLNSFSASVSAQVLINSATIAVGDINVKRYLCISGRANVLSLSRSRPTHAGQTDTRTYEARAGSAGGPANGRESAAAKS
jgi:hypothetical protein